MSALTSMQSFKKIEHVTANFGGRNPYHTGLMPEKAFNMITSGQMRLP